MSEELDILRIQLHILQGYEGSSDRKIYIDNNKLAESLKIPKEKIGVYLKAIPILREDEKKALYYEPDSITLHRSLLATTAKAIDAYEKASKKPDEKEVKVPAVATK